MAQASSKPKTPIDAVSKEPRQLELILTSHNPFWQSSLFNEVYLQNDVPTKYKEMWEEDEAGPFQVFCNQFINLCEELKDEDLNSWSERSTINKFVKPLLRMLGYFDKCSPNQEPWTEDETFSVKEGGELKTYKPDFIVVNDPKELKYISNKKAEEKNQEARSSVIVPIEAKYWGRIEDNRKNTSEDVKRSDKKDQADATRSLDFDEQCLKYMEILNKDYGILTDGKTWRLYSNELSTDSYRRNFQFSLGHLMKHVNAGLDKDPRDYKVFLENAKYFFHFFSKQALFSETGERRFLDDLLEYSKKYVTQVEEDLKDRFVKAMAYACNGFSRAATENKRSADLAIIRNVSESHLFNILFIKHCESRNVLPLKQSPEYRKISLSNIIDKLEHFSPERETDGLNLPVLTRMFSKDFKYNPSGTELYERLLKLTKLVQNGTKFSSESLEIDGFRESIFSKDELDFGEKYKLTNSEMVNILFELGYCTSDVPGKKYQQIPYNFFSPRQLGSIYESFLEFRLERAEEDMAFIKRQWVPANLKSEKIRSMDIPKVTSGGLFFCPDNEDRKTTGSYYTPDYVVQFIVREALSPLTKEKTAAEILALRVCDPAMGSGHFLNASLNFLARKYLEALERETNDDLTITLQDAKRAILPNAIYGADINLRAVKLAKMGLWLESAGAGKRLENLSNHLRCTDSLADENLWKKEWKFFEHGIDAVVGNPPYLKEANNKEIFEGLRKGFMGRYCVGKMDLWYLFTILAIDILKSGGRHSFIAPNTWVTSEAAKQLRSHIRSQTHFEKYVNFGDFKVFKDASIQTMVYVLSKTQGDSAGTQYYKYPPEVISEDASIDTLRRVNDSDYVQVNTDSKSLDENFVFVDATIDKIFLKIGGQNTRNLSDEEIGSGIDVLQDFVSKTHLPKLKNSSVKPGDGIFVLDNSEMKSVAISSSDRKKLKPYFTPDEFGRFSRDPKNRYWLIYSDEEVRNNIGSYPGIKKHLDRFKAVLTSVYKPYGLHRPREESLFSGGAIFSVRKTREPAFCFAEFPAYVSRAFLIIKPKSWKESSEYITAVLNSKLIHIWLYHKGKKQGEQLQVDKDPLMSIPIRTVRFDHVKEKALHDELVRICRELSSAKGVVSGSVFKAREKRLNAIVYELYGLRDAEIRALEDSMIPQRELSVKGELKKKAA